MGFCRFFKTSHKHYYALRNLFLKLSQCATVVGVAKKCYLRIVFR